MKGNRVKKTNLLIIAIFLSIIIGTGIFLYYTNKPIFKTNYIEDDFEDQIIGIFPAGWLSVINPFNVKVVSDDGNNVMEIKGVSSQGVTEICRRFKKTSIGVIQCKIKTRDINSRFVIHIPQLDREYDPYDDIIIAFLENGVYVIGEENLITLESDPSFWEKLMLLNNNISWAIDEQSVVHSVPVVEYEIDIWYLIRIDFNRESFLLTVNGDLLGEFDYPKYNPPYFSSLYFVSFTTPYNFKFYVDDVKITLSSPVDYIHPANLFLLILIPILVILIYIRFKKIKSKQKRR